MVQHLLARRGAARIALIPPEVMDALNEGLLPTVNPNEFLALDLPRLVRNVARDIGLDPSAERLEDTLAMLGAFRPIRRHQHVARAPYDITGERAERDVIARRLAVHTSDIARCWAAQWVGFSALDLPGKLDALRRFAADPHFGVREIAWSAVRDDVGADVDGAVRLLQPWVHEADPNLRRFATELTRPRGVWRAPLPVLKAEPWRAQSLPLAVQPCEP